jgi:hypothetical protein
MLKLARIARSSGEMRCWGEINCDASGVSQQGHPVNTLLSNQSAAGFVDAIIGELIETGIDLKTVTLDEFKQRLTEAMRRQFWRLGLDDAKAGRPHDELGRMRVDCAGKRNA